MRRRGPEEGAAALETAFVAPLFIIMVLAILNVGWALYCGAEVRHAVERSTRLLLEDPAIDEDTIEDAVQAELSAANADDVEVTLTTQDMGAGDVAKLSWTYTYRIDAPFIEAVDLDFDSSLVVPLRSG